MLLVDAGTPGLEVIRGHGFSGEPGPAHARLRFAGVARRDFEMPCERAVSRTTKGQRLADQRRRGGRR